MRAAPARSSARYRIAIASRALAASAGGYLLASACSVGIGLLLPGWGMLPVQAVIAANAVAFLAHATAVLWAFSCVSATRAWLGIAGPALLFAMTAAWLQRAHP